MQIDLGILAWPLNGVLTGLYIVVLVLLYLFRKKLPFVPWLMTGRAAVWTIVLFVVLALCLGVTGERSVLQSIPFLLSGLAMTMVLGLVVIKHLFAFSIRKIPFLCNHLGLFVILVAASMGSADLQRLRMTAYVNLPERQAVDKYGRVHELPFALELKDFSIDRHQTDGSPRNFVSQIVPHTQRGVGEPCILEVNRPLVLESWAIYQYGYDVSRGDDSDYSVLELVRDPWQPLVYAGVAMMVLGLLARLVVRGHGREGVC